MVGGKQKRPSCTEVVSEKGNNNHYHDGGACRDRTGDLIYAIDARYQLR
jgi:hypothetical protein